MAHTTPDIQILVGVLGGGSISGESGHLIAKQLGEIVASLNSQSVTKLKFSVDSAYLSNKLNAAITSANKISHKLAFNADENAIAASILQAITNINNGTGSTKLAPLAVKIDHTTLESEIAKVITQINNGGTSGPTSTSMIDLHVNKQMLLTEVSAAIKDLGVQQASLPPVIIPIALDHMRNQVRVALQTMPPVSIPCQCIGGTGVNGGGGNTGGTNNGGSAKNPSDNLKKKGRNRPKGQDYAAREYARAVALKTKLLTTETSDYDSKVYKERLDQYVKHRDNADAWIKKRAAKTKRGTDVIEEELKKSENVVAALDKQQEKQALYADQLKRSSLSANMAYDKVSDTVHKYWQDNQDTLAKSPKFYGQMKDLHDSLMSGTFKGTPKEAQAQFLSLRRSIGDAKADTESFGQQIKRTFADKLTFGILAAAAMYARRAIRQLYTNVVELDNAMAQMKIVTGESMQALEKYSKGAADAAKATGRTITEIMSSSTEYARLGYSLEESLSLSETTARLSNVADIETAEATSAMTAILKGFRLEAKDAEMVGDMMTKVANEYAIDAGELGAALERGGASLAAANNSLAESMALMAAGNAAIQNAETVGKQHCPAA